MEWKSKDLAIMRSLFREQVDESLKKKDRSVTLSVYDDSVTVSVLPLIEEKPLLKDELWKQYCYEDINITKQAFDLYKNKDQLITDIRITHSKLFGYTMTIRTGYGTDRKCVSRSYSEEQLRTTPAIYLLYDIQQMLGMLDGEV